ncbi:MAG: NAD(P)/FAD-dependent oxidoreductase [Actinomycetota bacterium]
MTETTVKTEHFDVLVVGAGISGVGAAYHLTHQRPDANFVVLENQETFGGTWITHTYPGIRSDSDLHTFGYRFKPWTSAPIATADEILSYMGEVIDENDLDRHIRYRHQIETASWSTEDRCWRLVATRLDTGERVEFTGNFLWMCQGYYRHTEGYTPEWPGMEDFGGTIVHPQIWPEDLDYEDKRVVVIGSGATAATLVPAMAAKTRHITMLQRSPTYFAAGRNANELAETLREIEIDETWIHEIVRRKVLFDQAQIDQASKEFPETVKEELYGRMREYLGDDYDMAPHFTPKYRPWQQRLAFVPDGDLFQAIARGDASVVTDEIDTFTASGIRLKSGETLEADIIVTATGFDLNVLGDIAFSIDGEPLAFHDTVTWRGAMFTGIPNMMWVFGYFRASWTLRVDMLADLVCRLLAEMDERGATMVVPAIPDGDADMPLLPWVDPEDFNPGYLTRGMHLLPRQGDRQPWVHTQSYWRDKDELPDAPLDDGTLRYR